MSVQCSQFNIVGGKGGIGENFTRITFTVPKRLARIVVTIHIMSTTLALLVHLCAPLAGKPSMIMLDSSNSLVVILAGFTKFLLASFCHYLFILRLVCTCRCHVCLSY